MFSWSYVIEYFPKIIDKFPVTLQLVFIPFVVSFALGFGIALLRLKNIRAIDWLLKLYVSYVRCTPVITQMFIVYFGLPVLLQKFGIDAYDWRPEVFVYIAYSINISAFLSETIRASILAVPAGQMEAGFSSVSGFALP